MNYNDRFKTTAIKPCGDGKSYVSCETDDKDAKSFSVSYPGMPCQSAALVFDNLAGAQETQWALECAFDAGKAEAFKELRKLIGVKDSR